MNETVNLVIQAITELVPQSIILNMAILLFVVTCCAIALIELSVAMFIGNIASLVNRILPESKSPKVSIEVGTSDKQQWLKKLVFWKKTS
jgi:hypothetical protein